MMTGGLSDIFFVNEIFEPLTKAIVTADIISWGAAASFIIASIHLERQKIRTI